MMDDTIDLRRLYDHHQIWLSACIMIATMMIIRHLSFADLPTLSESHNRGIATCFSSFRTSQTQLCGSGVCSDALSVVLPTVSFVVSQAQLRESAAR